VSLSRITKIGARLLAEACPEVDRISSEAAVAVISNRISHRTTVAGSTSTTTLHLASHPSGKVEAASIKVSSLAPEASTQEFKVLVHRLECLRWVDRWVDRWEVETTKKVSIFSRQITSVTFASTLSKVANAPTRANAYSLTDSMKFVLLAT
jgi:hypothetical protein